EGRGPGDVSRASAIVRRFLLAPRPFRVVDQDVLNGHCGLVYGIPSLEPGFILKVRRYDELRQAAAPQRLFDLLDGRLLVTRDEHAGLELLVSEPYQSQTNYLYRLPAGSGRAWLVGRVESADDGQ